MPINSAEHVVMGARALAPALGNRMIAAEFMGKPVIIRELLRLDFQGGDRAGKLTRVSKPAKSRII
jgi:hypothetical protein